MRATLTLLAAAMLVAGCSSSAAPAAQRTTTPASSSSSSSSAAQATGDQAGFLAGLRAVDLLGSYADADLVTAGEFMCGNRRAGRDPLDGTLPGDGQYVVPGVPVPVWAVDALSIDLQARQSLCPGVA